MVMGLTGTIEDGMCAVIECRVTNHVVCAADLLLAHTIYRFCLLPINCPQYRILLGLLLQASEQDGDCSRDLPIHPFQQCTFQDMGTESCLCTLCPKSCDSGKASGSNPKKDGLGLLAVAPRSCD